VAGDQVVHALIIRFEGWGEHGRSTATDTAIHVDAHGESLIRVTIPAVGKLAF